MSEILLLNPRARKRRAKKTTRKRLPARKTTTKRRATRRIARRKPVARRVATRKGASIMAKRRATRKRRAPRKNPSRARRAGRSIRRRASSSLAGLNFKSALKNVPMTTLGMFAAKWAAKRFGEAATETDPNSWNYASYLKGAAGAAAAGFIANMLKRGTGQRVLEGGLSLMAYKLVQNELIPQSSWATGQFGASDDRYPGVIEENDEGDPYILGEDNEWYPLEGAEDYRMMEPEMYGEALVEPGPLGDALVEPGPLGLGSDLDNLYRRSFVNR
ncbi:MAG: hypothetical protein KAV87_17485 [Desulfobacteraceae bacterium]|nr:hypothetical protein [Desulfobacteraceae bacterium]